MKNTVHYSFLTLSLLLSLNITAQEMMKKDVITVAPGDELQVVVDVIAKGKINRVPVVSNGRLTGIVTRGDIIRAMSTGGK